MPHSTFRYPFEFKMLDWTGELARELGIEGNPPRAFIVVIDLHTGIALPLRDIQPHEGRNAMNNCAALLTTAIMFDPFDWPEYSALEWVNLPRAVIEALRGSPWTPANFQPMRPSCSTHTPDAPSQWPESWDVIF